MQNVNTLILAIESSCDDTSCAVLRENLVLSNVVSSQSVHRHYGGVVPELASRDHIRNTDVQLGRLTEEVARGRVELSRELRNEIKLVARTIAIVAGEPQAAGD